MSGILYIVATPIGNLSDISVRALDTLKNVDFIAAEDTRVAMKLLSHFNIQKPLVSYYEHNKRERGDLVINRILAGENCALTTDAGTPVISDPGGLLVSECREAGILIYSIPGPCALITAFTLAGLESTRFTFEGFLSMTKRVRREHLESLIREKRPMIFYEAPHKLVATLEDFCEFFGKDRGLLVARELTKTFEESYRSTIGAALDKYKAESPRGEFVLVLDGASEQSTDSIDPIEAAVETAKAYINDGISLRDAVRRACDIYNAPKNAVYDICRNYDSK